MLVALDFESEAIDIRPTYPPKPVGLAVYAEYELPYYMAWGHPIENNSTQGQAVTVIQTLFQKPDYEFVFHNAPFDCSIIEEKFGLDVPWERVHDTMLAAFLLDPFGELSLKPLAENHLGEPPTERDAVREWLVAHGICRANDKSWAAWISKAPGALVGAYAIGDVTRTMKLHYHFKQLLQTKGMQ
jgi:DNA polymerase I-like protein with 3'-5' exonuclease and polymerase domains